MDVGDDCIEKFDAALDIRSMSCSPADSDRPSYEKIQVVVGKNFGVELADVGSILEGSKHVCGFLGRVGGTPFPIRFAPHAAEGITTSLEAAVQGGQDEGDHARLARINVAPMIGEGGNDFKSPVEEVVVLTQTSGVEEESALDAGQVRQGRTALQELVPRLCDIVWLFGKEQVACDRP
jgi:hypothetical protein